ncbi:DNA gyrase C-terminal beta-propeller domain-containing protein [Candidatus Amarobacter glycogenicus]|uniref:DNA gyrase C-terminal beta-propeller domain-containing protein n=1 Tax=Candidatus Amarobacter glycogenicus TaxID=3140699 RepID=UPI0031CC911C
MAAESTQVILVSSEGQAILFKIDDLRQASRTSGGVRGMKLAKGGYVVGVETLDDGRTAPHHLRERLRQAHASARNTRSRAAAARA